MTGDDRDGPASERIDFGTPLNQTVVAFILEVGSESHVIHGADNAIVELQDLHVLHRKDIWSIVVVGNTTYFHRGITDETIEDCIVSCATWLIIMSPVRCGPGFGAEACQRTVQVIEYVSEWSCVANLPHNT
jgi:hypothetical protein